MTDKAWFMRTFDAVVGEYADQGVELAKARDEVAHRYADAVETGQIAPVSSGLVETGRQSFNLFVKPAREARRQSMRKSAEDLIAALHNDGLLAEDDPILTQAFPLGDGRDKRLSDWAIADWQGARTESLCWAHQPDVRELPAMIEQRRAALHRLLAAEAES